MKSRQNFITTAVKAWCFGIKGDYSWTAFYM